MTKLLWDQVGERTYETGVDHGVLYIPNGSGVYNNGVAWNGLTSVSESPSGAESNAQYADNIKYLNLLSAEEFGATLEAFTYPDEFAEFDGLAVPVAGLVVGQQNRKVFGLSYRTKMGNDVEGDSFGYKLHLVYGCQASPSEKAYNTINDSPEAITFSWEISTTPVPVTNLKPTSLLVVDSTVVDPDNLADLEDLLYGTVGTDPQLPTPDEVIAALTTGLTTARLVGANAPSYNTGTHVVTIPTVTGVTWKINGVDATPGAQPAMTVGQSSTITAHAATGYIITGDADWTYDY